MIADLNKPAEGVLTSMPESMKFCRTDVSKEGSWKILVQETLDAFGRLDCLVNNAGTTHRNKVRAEPLSLPKPAPRFGR